MIIPGIWMSAIVYACEITILSIGFTLTWMTANIPNFAHGTYAGIGIYVIYTISKILHLNPYLGLPISFLIGGIISMLIYILIIGTINKVGGGDIVLTISTIAIQLFLTASIYIYAYWLRVKYKTYTMSFLLKNVDFKIYNYQGIFLISIIICIVTVILLHYMLTKTKIGLAMRATAENPELVSIVGGNPYSVQLVSWFITGGLACLAGSMLPFWFTCNPATGNFIIVTVMAGSLLGGLNYIYGAILGGFSVGLSEVLITYSIQSIKIGGKRLAWFGEYRTIIPLFVMIAILIMEPKGIQGIIDRFSRDKLMELFAHAKRFGRGKNL